MSFDTSGVLGTPDQPTTIHDPQARLDYEWDLDAVLDAGDVLTTLTWMAHLGKPDSGIVIPGVSLTTAIQNDRSAYAWLQVTDVTQTGDPGVPSLLGQKVACTLHFVTAAGRADDRTLYFKIKDR